MSENMQNTANDEYDGYEGDRHNRIFTPAALRLVELPQESSVDTQKLLEAQNVQDDTDDDAVQVIPGTSRKRPARPARLNPNPPYLSVEMWQIVFYNLEFFDPKYVQSLVRILSALQARQIAHAPRVTGKKGLLNTHWKT